MLKIDRLQLLLEYFKALYCLSSSSSFFSLSLANNSRTGGHEWVISAQGLIINIKYTFFLFCLVFFRSLLILSRFCSDFYFSLLLLNSNKSKWRSFSLEFIGSDSFFSFFPCLFSVWNRFYGHVFILYTVCLLE